MKVFLNLARIYIPAYLKKRKLQELLQLTADAFQCESPDTKDLSFDEGLKKFAQFTNEQVATAIQKKADLEAIRSRLYQNSFHIGQKIRKDFRITTQAEIMMMSKIIYRLLGIEFQYDMSGEVDIKSCFFSHFYISRVCQIISALDEGLFAGLSAGGRLLFKNRITEGKNCCRASYILPENLP